MVFKGPLKGMWCRYRGLVKFDSRKLHAVVEKVHSMYRSPILFNCISRKGWKSQKSTKITQECWLNEAILSYTDKSERNVCFRQESIDKTDQLSWGRTIPCFFRRLFLELALCIAFDLWMETWTTRSLVFLLRCRDWQSSASKNQFILCWPTVQDPAGLST